MANLEYGTKSIKNIEYGTSQVAEVLYKTEDGNDKTLWLWEPSEWIPTTISNWDLTSSSTWAKGNDVAGQYFYDNMNDSDAFHTMHTYYSGTITKDNAKTAMATKASVSSFSDSLLNQLKNNMCDNPVQRFTQARPCAQYGTITVPGWIKRLISEKGKTVYVELTATVYVWVKVNNLVGTSGKKPARTSGYLLLRNGTTASSTTTTLTQAATILCPGNEWWSAKEDSKTATVTAKSKNLTATTNSVTWALLLDCERITGQSSMDSWHTGKFTNISIKFVIE